MATLVELAVKRLDGLDETLAAKLLRWLNAQQPEPPPAPGLRPLGAKAMIGFAQRSGSAAASRPTADWMAELRAEEHEGHD